MKEFSSVSICALCLLFYRWTVPRRISCLTLPHEVFMQTDNIPCESLLQAEQLQLSQPSLGCQMFKSLNHLHIPSLGSLQCVHVLLHSLSQPGLSTGDVCPVCWAAPHPESAVLSCATQDAVGSCGWILFALLYSRILRFSSAKLLPSQLVHGVFPPPVVGLFTFIELVEVPVGPFHQPAEVLLMAAQLSCVTTPLSFVSPANLLRIHFVPSSRSLILNSVRPVLTLGIHH